MDGRLVSVVVLGLVLIVRVSVVKKTSVRISVVIELVLGFTFVLE